MAEHSAEEPRRFHIVKVKFHFWFHIVTHLTRFVKVSEQLNTPGREPCAAPQELCATRAGPCRVSRGPAIVSNAMAR